MRVELRRERLAAFAPLFFDFVTELEDLCTKYSVEELDQPPKTESRPTKKRR